MSEEEPQIFTRWIDPTIEKLQQENKQLKEEIRKMKNSKPYKILKEWEEFIENKEVNNYTDFEYKNKLFELKEKYK